MRIAAGRSAGHLLLAATLCVAYGCDNSSDSSDSARPVVAGLNAVADLSQVTFLREEEVWSALDYGAATSFRSVDADQYDINFDALLPGDDTSSCAGDVDRDDVKDDDECTRLVSQSINVIADHEYVVALLGRFGDVRVQVYDKLAYEFDTSTSDGDPADTIAEVQFFHWSDALGELDVYLEPPGTNLSPVQARGTLSSGGQFHALVEKGSYVLTLTAVGDPSALLFTSETFAVAAQTRVAFAILAGTDDRTSGIRVSRFRDQGGDLLGRFVTTELRATHVARDAGNVDVFAEQNYATALLRDLSFRETSEYKVIDPTVVSDLDLELTPAGNPGALLGREEFALSPGNRYTLFLVQPSSIATNIDGLLVQDRFRRVAPYATLRLVNSAGLSLDFYAIPRGNNVYTSTPLESLATGTSGNVHLLAPGSYDIFLARASSASYTLGPRPVELAGSGVYTIVAVPTTDLTRSDVVLLDDFAP
jgi:hypothetical protein